jgi:hypothetical protein
MRTKYPIDGDAVSIVPAAHRAGGKALARAAKPAP